MEHSLQDFVTDLGFIAASRLDVLLVAGTNLVDNTAFRSGRSHSSLRKISNGEFERKSELAGALQRSRFGDRLQTSQDPRCPSSDGHPASSPRVVVRRSARNG